MGVPGYFSTCDCASTKIRVRELETQLRRVWERVQELECELADRGAVITAMEEANRHVNREGEMDER